MTEQAKQGYKKLFILVVLFAVILIFRAFVLDRTIVSGNSMYPTLTNNDVCLTMKYDIKPDRYDIVIAKVDGVTVIKRVIGLPGETLKLIDDKVYIDGAAVNQKYDFLTENHGILDEPYTLADNEYFLMGDNRKDSYDSREFGAVKLSEIRGVVDVRIYPFNKITIYFQ